MDFKTKPTCPSCKADALLPISIQELFTHKIKPDIQKTWRFVAKIFPYSVGLCVALSFFNFLSIYWIFKKNNYLRDPSFQKQLIEEVGLELNLSSSPYPFSEKIITNIYETISRKLASISKNQQLLRNQQFTEHLKGMMRIYFFSGIIFSVGLIMSSLFILYSNSRWKNLDCRFQSVFF